MSNTLIEKRSLDQIEWPKLLSFLQKEAQTPLGREAAIALNPENDIDGAKKRLQETSEMRGLLESGERPPLSDVIDILPFVQAAKRRSLLDPEELTAIRNTLETGKSLQKFILSSRATIPALMEIADQILPFDQLLDLLNKTITPQGKISDYASPDLGLIRSEIQELSQSIHDKLEYFLKANFPEEYFQDDFITLRENRLVLPLKANMKGKFKGIIHDTSNTGQTYFIEPEEVVEMNNQLKITIREERKEIEKILSEVSSLIAEDEARIKSLIKAIQKIDLIYARVLLSNKLKGSPPHLSQSHGGISWLEARHPLMVLLDQEVVPNDLILESPACSMIITGPNAGGKTVAMKTIGLLSAMSQAGIFPPVAKDSSLPFFKKILVDLGDQQSLEAKLSTFSAHLKNLSEILKDANKESLVLIDEILIGTDAFEGEALAQSILEELVEKRATTIVTTHYPKLKKLPLEREDFCNASMQIDPDSGRPTYQMVSGIPGRSSALKIALEMGIPEGVVNRAKEHLGKEHQSLDRALQELEEEKRKCFSMQKELAKEKSLILQKENELSSEIALLKKEKKTKLLEEYDKWKKTLATTSRTLRELASSLGVKKSGEVSRKIKRIKKDVEAIIPDLEVPEETDWSKIKKGALIRFIENSQEGTLEEGPNRKGLLKVTLGSMTFEVDSNEIELIHRKEKKHLAQTRASSPERNYDEEIVIQTESNTCDLRGLRLDEALSQTTSFLDQASLSGDSPIVIIHGHGTARLKEGVRKYLKDSPYPAFFRPGREGEGGDGVTIVWID
jgi:DNA mismatch repair protein MutS2